MRIRLATPHDRDGVYEVCRRTGDAGADATGRFDDDDLLGDVYAGPYLALEPSLALVLVDDGQGTHNGGEVVAGYALGALDTVAFVADWRRRWLSALATDRPELRDPAAAEATPGDRVHNLLHHPELMVPSELVEKYPSHLHIDLLPCAQRQGHGRRLMTVLLERLRAAGSTGVHLGLDARNTGALVFYRRLGFHDLHVSASAILMGQRLSGH